MHACSLKRESDNPIADQKVVPSNGGARASGC